MEDLLVIEVLGDEAEPTQTMKLRFYMKDFIKDKSFGVIQDL